MDIDPDFVLLTPTATADSTEMASTQPLASQRPRRVPFPEAPHVKRSPPPQEEDVNRPPSSVLLEEDQRIIRLLHERLCQLHDPAALREHIEHEFQQVFIEKWMDDVVQLTIPRIKILQAMPQRTSVDLCFFPSTYPNDIPLPPVPSGVPQRLAASALKKWIMETPDYKVDISDFGGDGPNKGMYLKVTWKCWL